jgi:hypothetical protein
VTEGGRMRQDAAGKDDAGTLLGVPGHREGARGGAVRCAVCGSERTHPVCEADLEGMPPVDGVGGGGGHFARAFAAEKADLGLEATASDGTAAGGDDWGPADWSGDDGVRFLQGLIIALILAAPLWAVLAALLGWL